VRTHAERAFGADRMVDAYVEVYRRVIAQHAQRAGQRRGGQPA
jgi:hypothetical protein